MRAPAADIHRRPIGLMAARKINESRMRSTSKPQRLRSLGFLVRGSQCNALTNPSQRAHQPGIPCPQYFWRSRTTPSTPGVFMPTIRLALTSDIEALVELRSAFLDEIASRDVASSDLRASMRTYFHHAITSGECVAFLAFDRTIAIASSGMVLRSLPPSQSCPRGREAYILNMYTVPAWPGRGLGNDLLGRCVTLALDAGCDRISLHGVPTARSMYERFGFTAIESEMRLAL